MAAPHRGNTGHSVYFITACTFQKNSLFQSERVAQQFLEHLFHYRDHKDYLLHEFVVMPDHFHLLITPLFTLERALQLIKGGFSFKAKKQLGFGGEIWEKSFYDRRVRNMEEYRLFCHYIHQNPVKRGLVAAAEDYRCSSACGRFVCDAIPQRLKPDTMTA
jgi:putative transposase